MPYITVPLAPVYRQLTFEDIISGRVDVSKPVYTNESNTKTVYVDNPNYDLVRKANVYGFTKQLRAFNQSFAHLFDAERSSLYRSFKIPKKSGGMRQIDAPEDELMTALYTLKGILESRGATHHTTAFAYVRRRSPKNALERHQRNESHWYLKMDFSNFFGSTTKEFVERMMESIYPFSEVMRDTDGRAELMKALDLCFLNGGLPQGTPMSPMLTNLIMIPVDHLFSRALRSHNDNFVYTRYADDILVSCKVDFKQEEIISMLTDVLNEVGAPYALNEEKTRYGSRAGSNWNLGLMINKDNQITIGHKRKKHIHAMVHNYLADRENGVAWSVEDVMYMEGVLSYLKGIEPEYYNRVLLFNNEKFSTSLLDCIREDKS